MNTSTPSTSTGTTATITRQQVAEGHRIAITAKLFGSHFPIQIEPAVYSITGSIADTYHGGYWTFYVLGNGAFYMAPDAAGDFAVSCQNGFEGTLSADALGITACLYAYSHLSFGEDDFAETCANQYHLLRDYMLDHHEARSILSAID